jgi:hypothetical protein
MIKILKKLRREKGLYLITTELDAKAADITTNYEKEVIEYYLEEHLIKVSENIENEFVLERFKKFLVDTVFVHYVDLVGILNYIYTMRNVIKVARKHPSHNKFLFTTEFKNYAGDKSDDEEEIDTDEDNDEGAFFSLNFKTELLDKKNLSPIGDVLFHSLTSLYQGDILVSKPKKVKIFLTKRGTEEFVNINVSFCKSNK